MTLAIAIVGTGIAGLAAARRLRESGFVCTLFDKSRGLGGRMATRRVDDLHFDHGAQFFTARSARFSALVAQWCAAGQAAPWFDDRHVGTPGMSAPVRAMLGGETVVSGCQVAALHRGPGGWTVATAAGPVGTPGNGAFAAVLLAVPAPQARPLAASAGIVFPELAHASYAPCWTLMLGFDAPCGLAEDRIRREDGAIAWVARNASKPGRARDREAVVVQAAPDWSRAHLEAPPDEVAPLLLREFAAATGVVAAPVHVAAHRWRYALVEETAGRACLWDPGAGLGACGDWCLGARVEAAFESGEALADAVSATLSGR